MDTITKNTSTTMDKKLVYEARKHLRKENSKYGDRFESLPPEKWPEPFRLPSIPLKRVMRNAGFLVMDYAPHNSEVLSQLGVVRTDIDDQGRWLDGITWDELMAVKRGVGFGDAPAVEAYPEDSRTVNVANIRWLWILYVRPQFFWK